MRTARINRKFFQLRLSKAAAFVSRGFRSALVRILSKPRLIKLETEEIPQKALSDALSSQWVDNLIANMPTKGTRGHIRELRNHLFRCCVKPKKSRLPRFQGFYLPRLHIIYQKYLEEIQIIAKMARKPIMKL